MDPRYNYKQLMELSSVAGLLAWEQVSTGITAGAFLFLLLSIRIFLKEKRSFYLSANAGINFPGRPIIIIMNGDIMKRNPMPVFIGAQALGIRSVLEKVMMLY